MQTTPSGRDATILDHLPLVNRMVRRVSRKLPSSMDKHALFGAAVEGLIFAVDHFDEDKGVSFESYARIRIRGALQDELRNLDHLTRDQRRLVTSVMEARDRLTRELGREVADDEVAESTDLSLEEVQRSQLCQLGPQVVDPCVMDETLSATPWQSPTGAEQALLQKQQRHLVEAALTTLTEREQLVMGLYYEEGLNLTEVGEILDVSPSRISQIISKVKRQLNEVLADC